MYILKLHCNSIISLHCSNNHTVELSLSLAVSLLIFGSTGFSALNKKVWYCTSYACDLNRQCALFFIFSVLHHLSFFLAFTSTEMRGRLLRGKVWENFWVWFCKYNLVLFEQRWTSFVAYKSLTIEPGAGLQVCLTPAKKNYLSPRPAKRIDSHVSVEAS